MRVSARDREAFRSIARADYAVLGLLALSVCGSVLAVGSVHVQVLLFFSALLLSAGVVALFVEKESFNVPAPALVLLALSAYTALQAIPLPRAVVAQLAPRNLEVWDHAYDLLKQEHLSWVSLSVDSRASWVETLKWLTYAAAFVAAVRAGRKLMPGAIPALIFLSAVCAALTALGHRLASATTLFGIYKPIYAGTVVLAPLLNLNNFAGYLNLGAFAGLGLLVARESLMPRWTIALGVAVVIGVSVTSVSRGGFSSLMIGVVLLVFLLRRRRFEDKRRQRLLVGMQIGTVALGLLLFTLSATAASWKVLLQESLQKIDVISWTKPLILNHFWIGVGRGAFETAFPPYRSAGGGYVYHLAENFLAQWCSEWGVPVALVGFGCLCWTLRPSRIGLQRSTLALACVVGAGTLILQNLVDLALEVPSVSIALFVLLGGVFGAAQSAEAPRKEPQEGRAPGRLAAFALAGSGVCLLSLVALVGTWPAERDRRHVADAVNSAKRDELANRAALARMEQALRRHPGDPYLPLAAAMAARRLGQNPMPWIGGAIERDPAAGRPYLVLATELARRGATDQALHSLRLSLERDASLSPTAAQLAILLTHDLETIRGIAPGGIIGVAFLAHAGIAVSSVDHWELRGALLDAALAREPANRTALTARLNDLLGQLEGKGEACNEQHASACRERVEKLLQEVQRATPANPLLLLTRARLLLLDQRPDEAAKLLAARCPELGQAASDCARLWFTTAVRRDDAQALEQAATTYLGVACAAPASCARAALWLGDQYESRGMWGTALRMYERAARESDNPAVWNRVARAAARAGMYSVAQRAVQRLRRSGQHVDQRLLKEIETARVNQLDPLTR